MKKWQLLVLGACCCIMLAFVGCTKNYMILHDLEQPLGNGIRCSVGDITDELPEDFAPEDKPTIENINSFRNRLIEELEKADIFDEVLYFEPNASTYEVTGSIIDYSKGSGTLRFFIGFGAGNSKVVINLEMKEVKTGNVVFSANFTGSVSSWAEKGDKCFEQVAKSFAKQLKKRQKKLLKEAEQG